MENLQFVGLAKPTRENWLLSITQEEQAVMEQHFEYVKKLHSEGGIIMAGACLNGAYGIIIYKAQSKEAAFQMYENDPLVKSGIMNTEFHPFRVGYLSDYSS